MGGQGPRDYFLTKSAGKMAVEVVLAQETFGTMRLSAHDESFGGIEGLSD